MNMNMKNNKNMKNQSNDGGGWRLEWSQIFNQRLSSWWSSTPPSLGVKLNSHSSMKSQSDVEVEEEDGTQFLKKW